MWQTIVRGVTKAGRIIWRNRQTIAMALEALRKILSLRKAAKEFVSAYIKERMTSGLLDTIIYTLSNIAILSILALLLWLTNYHISFRLISSIILIGLIIFNAYGLVFITIPQIREIIKTVRGRTGYLIKHAFSISVFELLFTGQLLILILLAGILIGSRSEILSQFELIAPWLEIVRK